MGKYRIIKLTKGNATWYEVQRRFLFIWISTIESKVAMHLSFQTAKNELDYLIELYNKRKAKTKKEIMQVY